ncbi:MAG: cytochrome c biogenesis protein CcsA, partial [bacterium]
MTKGEGIFFWIAVAFYIGSVFFYIAGAIFRKERWCGLATGITLAAFTAHTTAIVVRWISAGHPPIMRNYENALAGSWLIILIFLLLVWRFRSFAIIGASIVPIILLMLGYGIMNFPKLEPLTPQYQNIWLYVHVIFAWFAYGAYVIAFGLAVLFLLKERKDREYSAGCGDPALQGAS